jgi:ribosome-binding factor A
MAERRPERVAHLVQAELARWLLQEAGDPRLQQVTITAVRMSPDLRLARVYVRTLAGPEAGDEMLRALRRGASHLRAVLGRALALRVTPELRFEYDATPDQARRVDELLRRGVPPDSDEEK